MVNYFKLKVLEVSNLILENEIHINWRDILDVFEFKELFIKYPDLNNDQKWRNPSYSTYVTNIFFDSINQDKQRAFKMIEYILKNCTYCEEKEINKYIREFKGLTPYLQSDMTTNKEINDLIDNINESIVSGNPVFALDRLHTLMQKYLKELCIKHKIHFKKNARIDELLKEYVNCVDKYIESNMTSTILKSSISQFSQFNNIRNNYSHAHDNHILNDSESKLIFNNIVNIKEFIDEIEENFSN